MNNSKTEPTLIIMAAGMGSRYGGSKQIDKMTDAGEIIMDFSLYDAMLAGFKKAVLVIREEMKEVFSELMDERAGKYMQVQYAFQKTDDLPSGYDVPEGRTKPWGTGQAILAARNLVQGSFAVINADDYYGAGAFQSMYEFLTKENEEGADGELCEHFAMVGYQLKNTITENGHVSRGVCTVNEEGNLSEIVERTKIQRVDGDICYSEDDGENWHKLKEETLVSMNFWGFTGLMMQELKKRFPLFLEKAQKENPMKAEYLLPEIAGELVKEGMADVKVLTSEDRWYGVTYKEDKESVTAALQSLKDKGMYPYVLWK